MVCSAAGDWQRGDTIVEVMFAIAVFAFVAAGSLAVMNRGIQTTQRSLEITQVRQAMNDQAELLRYAEQNALANSDTASLWHQITKPTHQESTISPYGQLSGGRCPQKASDLEAGAHPFVVDPKSMSVQTASLFGNSPAVAYPQLVYNAAGSFQGSYGLWIEESVTTNHFIDFNIRACWDAPGSTVPVSLGTVVRLYAQ